MPDPLAVIGHAKPDFHALVGATTAGSIETARPITPQIRGAGKERWATSRTVDADYVSRAFDPLGAAAMGFTNVQHLSDEVRRLRTAIENREALSVEDWRRVLLATEIAFVDDVFGSGLDWPMATGFKDELTITMLRAAARDAAMEREGVVLDL